MSNNSQWFKTIAVILVFGCVSSASAQPDSFWVVENEVQSEMINTHAFYTATRAGLRTAIIKWPESQPALEQADRRFAAAYGAAVKDIDAVLMRKNSSWPTTKAEHEAFFRTKSEELHKEWTPAVLTNFINDVEARSRGAIPSPWIETLLKHKPEYRREPELEFRDGYRKVFRSSSHAMTTGVPFQLSLPQSWSAANTQLSPSTGLAIFTSENGRGLQMVNIVAIDHPFGPGTNQTEAALRAQFEPDAVRKMIPETGLQDARYVRSDNQLTIGGQPAGSVEFTFTSRSSQGQLQSARTLWYFIWLPNETKSVLLQFNVFHIPLEPSLEGTFQRFAKLFETVAHSFSLGDKPVAGVVANPHPAPAGSTSSLPTTPATIPVSRSPAASAQPNWNRDNEQRQYEDRRRREQQRLEEERQQAEQRLRQGQWQRQQEEQRRRDLERQRQQRKPGWY